MLTMKIPKAFLLVTAMSTVLLTLAPGQVSAQSPFEFRFGTLTRPLTGSRYETMRALSHYLDEQATHAARAARWGIHHGSPEEFRLLRSMQNFRERTEDFHSRMDEYLEERWEIPPEVLSLESSAHRVSYRLRRSHAFPHVYDDWEEVLDTIDLMKRVLAGYRVRVPRAHAGFRDYDRYDYDRNNNEYDRHDLDRYDYDRDNNDYDHDRDH